jgi:hypothetical protein
MVQGLFGGGAAGDEEKAKAEDFINRYQTGKPTEGYTEREAIEQLQAAAKVATPEQMQAAFKHSVANLPEDERAQFNQMLQDRKAGTGMIDIERSGERTVAGSGDSSGGDSVGLDDLLGGLLGGTAGGSAGSSGGGGLGDILGGLLGNASGGSGSSGGGLDDILGGMMGGTGSAAAPASESKGSGGGGIGDLLGGLLSSPAGKAVLAGTAAFAMKEVLGKK